jgi:carboxymethylenebutenolidase
MSKTVQLKRPDGRDLEGYLAEPTTQRNPPGLVVIQEWWGINDQIKGVADRLARAGYRALVPDLYRGKRALDEHEAKHLMNNLNFGDAASQDIRGAVQYLKSSGSPKIGVLGFCIGGALTVLSLVHVPEVDAGIVWYGSPPLDQVDAAKIKAPMMIHWGIHDAAFPITLAEGLEKKLRTAGVHFEFHRYDAKHAFANETADATGLPYLKYDRDATELAWQRTMGFLAAHLPVP